MKRTIPTILLAVLCAGCVTDDEDKGAINPSDVAFAGTGLAVVSSAGIDDDDNANFNSSFNSSNPNNANPNNSNPNSTFNSSNPNSTSGTNPWDLDCEASLTVSGAVDDTFTETSGCSGGSGGSSQSISWVWGLETQWQLSLRDVPIRSASDTSSFATDVIFGPFALGASGPDTGWMTSCTVNLDSSEEYTDGRGDRNAIWIGSLDCPDPASPVEREDEIGADWMTVDGDPIIIESLTFETPYPSAL